jgi:hypothetical protein
LVSPLLDSDSLGLPLILVIQVSLVNPRLHVRRLLEAPFERMLARPVSRKVRAPLAMSRFTSQVSTSLTNPRDHAAATKSIAAFTLGKLAFFLVEEHVAARTRLESFVGFALCGSVDGRLPFTIGRAGLVFVLRSVAVDTCLASAVFASEDSAVLRAVEELKNFSAAVHAGHAYFEFLGVSMWRMLEGFRRVG